MRNNDQPDGHFTLFLSGLKTTRPLYTGLFACACLSETAEDEPARCGTRVLVINTAFSQVTGAPFSGEHGNSGFCSLSSSSGCATCDLRKRGAFIQSLLSCIQGWS